MSKPPSSRTRTVTLSPQGEPPGIRIIGFHGEVDAAHTPARRSPLLADEEGWLVRLLPPDAGPEGASLSGREPPLRIQVERGSLRVGETGPLPGVGTRLGPWPARFGYTVVLVGQAEQRVASRLASHLPAGEPGVARFVHWLAQGCPEPTPERVAQVNGLVAWYCSETEAHALWLSILQEARLTMFRTFGHQPRHLLEETAWWLSRAALSDDDLYLAAACLKHAGSPHAEAMLRAMLGEPPSSEEMQKRMSQQLLFLDAEAGLTSHEEDPTHTDIPHEHSYAVLTNARERVRQGGLIQARVR